MSTFKLLETTSARDRQYFTNPFQDDGFFISNNNKNYVFVAEHPTFKTPLRDLRPHGGSCSRPLIRDSVHSRGLRNSS